MQSKAATPQEYIDSLPPERKQAMTELRKVIRKNIPKGFSEIMNYGMICYVVPHSLYPKGYHCDAKQPLPFLGIAYQKHFIAIYHMGIYAEKDLFNWYMGEFLKHSKAKPDMGKGCLRFKKADQIPFRLIADLVAKRTPNDWIKVYERAFIKTKHKDFKK